MTVSITTGINITGGCYLGQEACDFNYPSVSLLLPMNWINSNTNFTDYSPSPKTITRNGNTAISTAQYKWNGTSGYFDGTGDWLYASTGTGDFFTNDFTIEGWFNWVSLTNGGLFHVFPGTPSGVTTGLAVGYDGTNFQVYSGSATYSRSYTPTVGIWYHVALVRSSGSLTLYVNGVAQGASISDGINYGGNGVNVGLYYSSSFTFYGYINDFRVTNGIARYTSGFTPPSAPFAAQSCYSCDTNYTSVSLLLPMNGANNSTTFTDYSPSPKTVTPNGGAAISTTQSKFDGSSLLVDSTTKYLSVPNNVAFDVGSGTFTIEFWIYATTWGSVSILLSKRASALNQSPLLVYGAGGTIYARFTNSGGTEYTITGSALSTSTWYHIAYVRSGDNTYLFVNGTQVGSTTVVSGSAITNADLLRIGNDQSYGVPPPTTSTFYMDDLRITKGVARYTANFTPPTAPLPTQAC